MTLLTEDEVKTKRCCGPEGCGEARHEHGGLDGHGVEGRRYCIGSDCAGWRWKPLMVSEEWKNAVKKAAIELKDNDPRRHKSAVHVNENRAKYGLPDKPFHGYCGLSGRPE